MNSKAVATSVPVLGRYEMLMPIGSGGMATVWAARLRGSRGFQRIVAVKTILPEFVRDPSFDRMFFEEASLASRIHHPHVAEILDLAEYDGALYVVMEWVDGETLGALIKAARSAGGIPLPVAVRIISQACAGLHAAHELRDETGELLGLVHRDVSPQNVIITMHGVVKVVDFGIAKAAGRVADQASASQIAGKVAYMSPEQAKGDDIDRRSDVFALGILLYWMTTGAHPFRASTQEKTLANIRSYTGVRAPHLFVPDYPAGLEQVVLKALAPNRDGRYTTASEMLHALDRALPQSTCASNDDIVAEFMRKVLGEKHESRMALLNDALVAADQRAPRDDSSDATISRVRMNSGLRLVKATEVRAEIARLTSPADASGANVAAPVPPVIEATASTATLTEPAPPFRRRRLWLAALAASLVVGTTAAILALQPHPAASSSNSSSPSPPTSPSLAGPAASSGPDLAHRLDAPPGPDLAHRLDAPPGPEAPHGQTPVAASAQAAGDTEELDDAPVPASGLAPGQTQPRRNVLARKRVPTRPGSGTFVSPVREPGF